jgi:hypothetical protein
VKFSLNEHNNEEEDEEDSLERVVQRVVSEIVSLIESESSHADIDATVETNNGEENTCDEEYEEEEYEEEEVELDTPEATKEDTKPTAVDESDGRYLIDTCLVHLKQLCYTFFANHMFLNDPSTAVCIEEQISKSFASLFHTDATAGSSSSSSSNGSSPSEDRLVLDDQANYLSVLSTVSFIKLRHESLTYLQSFQILNKLLIKMLFFPREPSNAAAALSTANQKESNSTGGAANATEGGDDAMSSEANSENEKFLRSFEDWLKSLFVVSCASQFVTSHAASVQSKLFEFQSVTLNTIIELIHLSESVNSHFSSGPSIQQPMSLVAASNNFRVFNFTFS